MAITFIIRRDLTELAAYVRAEFNDTAYPIGVVIDRRFGERRRMQLTPAVERRRCERRQRDVTKELSTLGWVIIPSDG